MLHLSSIILKFRDLLICEYYVALVRYFLFEFCNSHAIASNWFGSCESKRQKDREHLNSVSWPYYWKIIKSFILQPRRNLTQSLRSRLKLPILLCFMKIIILGRIDHVKLLKFLMFFIWIEPPLMHWYSCISFSFVLSLILSYCISVTNNYD